MMETLLRGPVSFAQPHAIPFRAIFEEHLRRQKFDAKNLGNQKLESAVCRILHSSKPDDVPFLLGQLIDSQEEAYGKLARANQVISEGKTPAPSPQKLVKDCHELDQKLTTILHAMECSALCLSGGGIRSASFCLGVLEGLARFSNPDDPEGGLMYELDYLSTVSGGGYIGSWLTAWIDQRRRADGFLTPMTQALAAMEECDEKLGTAPVAAENEVIEACIKRLREIGGGATSYLENAKKRCVPSFATPTQSPAMTMAKAF